MKNKQEQFDLDLDTISSQSKTIRFNGEAVEIFPPDLEELFGLQGLALKFKEMDTDNMSDEEASEVFAELKGAFTRLIPPLKKAMEEPKIITFLRRLFPNWKRLQKSKSLSLAQMFALLDLIVNMAVPADVKELEKHGITLNSNQKKILSNRLKK